MTGGAGAGVLAVGLAAAAGAVLPRQRDSLLRRVAATGSGRVAAGRPSCRGGHRCRSSRWRWAGGAGRCCSRSPLGWRRWPPAGPGLGPGWTSVRRAAPSRGTRPGHDPRSRAARRRRAAGGAGGSGRSAHPTVAAAARSPAADVPGRAGGGRRGRRAALGPRRGLAGGRGRPAPGWPARQRGWPWQRGLTSPSAARWRHSWPVRGRRHCCSRCCRSPASCSAPRSGANPGGFLLTTPPGQLCLVVGTLLVAAGVGWTEAIADRAERP